jgi:hypothetical protein
LNRDGIGFETVSVEQRPVGIGHGLDAGHRAQMVRHLVPYGTGFIPWIDDIDIDEPLGRNTIWLSVQTVESSNE